MPQKPPKAKVRVGVLDFVWERALRQGLEDDGAFDWTTIGSLKRPEKPVLAQVIAKSPGVWASDGLFSALERLAPEISCRSYVQDGAPLKSGQVVCEWRGPANLVLAYERPFLNLASYTGGIAFHTSRLVHAVRKACPKETPRVAATRKTLPGYRDLAICGVLAGGGHSHRVSLSGGILIKENHIAAAGGISAALAQVRKSAPHGLKLEIEVRNLEELKQALLAQADVVLLDNFSPGEVKTALRLTQNVEVEVSGGLNEANIASYAMPGVDILSVGSLTHSVSVIDLSLLIQ